MRDYSELHDAEINMLVCKQLGLGLSSYCRILSVGDYSILLDDNKTLVDYCNNPADAWPIISSNRISISFDGDFYEGKPSGLVRAHANIASRDYMVIISDALENPLRAAMIVYLQMMETKA